MNLAKIENLIEVATEVGLSARDAEHALSQRQFRDAVDVDWQRSQALGSRACRRLSAEVQALVGAQPLEQLEALVSSDGAARR